VADADEYFGFKLENGLVRFRNSISNIATYPNCIGTDCCNSANGNWESISDSNEITITNLAISEANSKCQNVTQNQTCATGVSSGDTIAVSREVDISISAELANDSLVSKTQTATVKVRNDRIYTQP
jgi:hypothetical protein